VTRKKTIMFLDRPCAVSDFILSLSDVAAVAMASSSIYRMRQYSLGPHRQWTCRACLFFVGKQDRCDAGEREGARAYHRSLRPRPTILPIRYRLRAPSVWWCATVTAPLLIGNNHHLLRCMSRNNRNAPLKSRRRPRRTASSTAAPARRHGRPASELTSQ